MAFAYRYLLIFLACVALLLGIQVPSFVDQYQKRLDAHLLEVTADLKGYQDIANADFGGSMELLIRRHKESADMVFRDEAGPIETMYLRFLHFREQAGGLHTDLAGKVIYIFRYGDHELLRETMAVYSYNIPLDSLAIYCGFAAVAIVLALTELLAGILGLVTGLGTRRTVRY